MLADRDLTNPLLWAVIIGWIMTVILHEFAHGFVAMLGGDYTIRQRGGLTLNPLQYIDPVGSILLPVVFVLMGGIPLPGGVTYIRRDLLRRPIWGSAVSLAGPAMNFLLFLALSAPLHPKFGWVNYDAGAENWTNGQMFLATLAQLQIVAVVLNLIPIPPLDGFGIVSPYMDETTRQKFNSPQAMRIGLLILFFVVWRIPQLWTGIYSIKDMLLNQLGFDSESQKFFSEAFNHVLFGV